jgi:NAD(P)H-dependent FMN reductase
MTVISVIVGSTREGRFSERPAKWILQHLKKREGVDARLLDLRDFPMPFFDQPAPPGHAGSPALQERDRAAMDRRDRAVRRLRLRHP